MKWRRFRDRFNKLDSIVRISFFAVSIVPLLLYLVLNSVAISDNFSRLEQKSVQMETAHGVKLFHSMALELGKWTKDYAIWDEPYQKIMQKDSQWFRENVTGWLPKNSGIDLIIVADTHKNVIDQFGIKSANPQELLNDSSVNKVLKDDIFRKPELYPNGLKVFQGKLYLVTVSPILQSYYRGNPGGIIIFGKLITPEMLADIGRNFGYRMIVSYGDNIISVPGNLTAAKGYLELYKQHNHQGVTEVEESLIMGSIEMTDMSANVIGRLFILQPRDMFSSTVNLIRINGYMALGLSLIIILILSTKLRKVIVDPIHKLEEQISHMGPEHLLGHVEVLGSEELASLGATFNRMADSLMQYKKENESLKYLSITDHLTGLYNHRYFFEFINQKIAAGCKNMTLLFCDIDHFKVINDLNGHSIGDLVLREVADILRAAVEDNGTVFRFGGEEFIILFENRHPRQAYEFAEELRLKVARSEMLEQRSGYFPVTISIGLAGYPADGLKDETLVRNADRAMYYAKQNGRNQCQIYRPDLEEMLGEQSVEFSRQEMLIESAYTLAAIIDAKDKYTEKHSESVVKFALRLAEQLHMSERDKYLIKIGGLLHDLGKIGVPDEIIHKNGPLSEEDWKVIKSHPMLGSNIVRHSLHTPEIETCVRYHHERWDGKGYPDGLAGTAIPLYARIIGIADAYHAMISDRPYRKALSQEEAFYQLRKNAGLQFDPDLVEPFITAISGQAADYLHPTG